MNSGIFKWIIAGTLIIVLALGCALGVMWITTQMKTSAIRDDYSSMLTDSRYSTPVHVEGVEAITQDISCGFAVIEMVSTWNGGSITEESLYEELGKVTTSTGKSFRDEMARRFPEYTVTMHSYLKNTELLDTIYKSLEAGMPVPIEWAAKDGDEWTLHFSLVIGMDIPNDQITVANPYGYIEKITIAEFLDRTSFDAYKDMPIPLQFGFLFGYFEKNTVFLLTPATE